MSLRDGVTWRSCLDTSSWRQNGMVVEWDGGGGMGGGR